MNHFNVLIGSIVALIISVSPPPVAVCMCVSIDNMKWPLHPLPAMQSYFYSYICIHFKVT